MRSLFLWILAAIFLILVLLLLLRVRFDIQCSDETAVNLRILGIKFPLYPQTKKKVRVSRFKKGYPKQKEKKPAEKKAEKKPEKPADTIPLGEKIETVISLVKLLCAKLFKHLRLDVSQIVITVGGGDAASCAITYGIVSQAVVYLLAFLDDHMKIRKKRGGEIDVRCDFTAETTTCDILISASLTVWQLLDIAISLAYNYFKGKDIFHLTKS